MHGGKWKEGVMGHKHTSQKLKGKLLSLCITLAMMENNITLAMMENNITLAMMEKNKRVCENN